MKLWFFLLAAVITLGPVQSGRAADKKVDPANEQHSGNRKNSHPSEDKGGGAISTSATVQLQPIMAPYRSATGVHYDILVVRIEIPNGLNARSACYTIPIIHDRLVQYVYSANLTADDFVGERRDVLAKSLFDVVVQITGPGYYSKLELPGSDAPELDDNDSITLTQQCEPK